MHRASVKIPSAKNCSTAILSFWPSIVNFIRPIIWKSNLPSHSSTINKFVIKLSLLVCLFMKSPVGFICGQVTFKLIKFYHAIECIHEITCSFSICAIWKKSIFTKKLIKHRDIEGLADESISMLFTNKGFNNNICPNPLSLLAALEGLN